MLAKEIMTRHPTCATTNATVASVAQLMRDTNCGSIPVTDHATGKLLGVVTDRDLAVRALADGEGAATSVSKVMTIYPFTASPDDDVMDIERLMSERQVRRVPVVDADGICVGIIAQADLARAAAAHVVSEKEVAIVLERISSKSVPAPEAARTSAAVDYTAATVPIRTIPPAD